MLDDARELATKTAAACLTANAPARTARNHADRCLPMSPDAPPAQTLPRAKAALLPAAQGQSVVDKVTIMISATYNVDDQRRRQASAGLICWANRIINASDTATNSSSS